MSFKSSRLAAVLGAIALSVGAPSWAALVADGLTYTLLETPISSTDVQFTLDITGINASTDAEGGLLAGRYGVNSIAFTEMPVGSVVNGTLTNFNFMTGGLNAMGCDGSGNFFCFKAKTLPPGPALPANSELTFTFDLTVNSNFDPATYNPDFKIQWWGTKSSGNKSNYDLVSQTLTPTVVPLPAALPLLLSALGGLGFMGRRKAA